MNSPARSCVKAIPEASNLRSISPCIRAKRKGESSSGMIPESLTTWTTPALAAASMKVDCTSSMSGADDEMSMARSTPRSGPASVSGSAMSPSTTSTPGRAASPSARPGLRTMALERLRAGDVGERDLQETLEDAAQLAILDQERAGLDLVSDGEVRRHDFILSFYGRLTGLRETPPARRLGPYLYDSTPVWEVTEPVAAPEGLGTVQEFEFAASRTARPVKVACPGPLTLNRPLTLAGGYA